MTLHRLVPVLFSTNPDDIIAYLKPRGLLRTQQDCSTCGVFMEWKKRATCGDRF